MTRSRPGRLYRKLPSIIKPIFYFYMEGREWLYDSDISSVVIRRGLGEPAGGVGISTMEITIPSVIPFASLTGLNAGLSIAGNRAAQLAEITGYPDSTKLMRRFQGRVGPLSVTDTGKTRTSSSKITASSWISQESRSGHTTTLTAPTYIDDALRQLSYRAPNYYTLYAYGQFDSLVETIEGATWRGDAAKLTSDYEILVGDLRNGHARAMTLPWRLEQALARVQTTYPLLRSQALSPATWEQSSETVASRWHFRYVNSTGVLSSVTRFIESQIAGDAETKTVDWEHFRVRSDHWDLASRAIVHRDNIRSYSLPSIKVDLLQLLSSERAYDRRVAGELLALETGDSLNLAGDWPSALQGIQIVTGMTETITGDSWTLDLSLATLLDVFGEWPQRIPAIVWEQATYPWDTETRRWNLEET